MRIEEWYNLSEQRISRRKKSVILKESKVEVGTEEWPLDLAVRRS